MRASSAANDVMALPRERKTFDVDINRIPEEIRNAIPRPPFTFPDAEITNVVFATDPDIVAQLVPPPLELLAGSPGLMTLSFPQYPLGATSASGTLEAYSELVLLVPVTFEGTAGTFCVQLYLAGILPGSNVNPTVAGLGVYGFPKRDGQLVSYTSADTTRKVWYRWGQEIVDATFVALQSAPAAQSSPADQPAVAEPIYLLKYIPSAAANGDPCGEPDVLSLIKVAPGPTVVKATAPLSVTIRGQQLTLDTGRVIRIREVVSAWKTIVTFTLGPSETVLRYNPTNTARA